MDNETKNGTQLVKKQNDRKRIPTSIHALDTIGYWMMIVGFVLGGAALVVSSISAVILYRASNRSQDEANQRIAVVQAETARANERAAKAELDLAKFKAPRAISDADQENISKAIGGFAGTQFDLSIPPGDPEATTFSELIEKVLKNGGWHQIDWVGGDMVVARKASGLPNLGIASLLGVVIQMHPEQIPKYWPIAQTLVAALSAAGIEAKAEQGIGPENSNINALHLLIGKKP